MDELERRSRTAGIPREIYNAKVAQFGKSLPGREDDCTDTSRGFAGWGPYEDGTGDEGRTVEHADWQALLSTMQNPVREIIDFYFAIDTPSKTCACCSGSGINSKYAELERGFYKHGGGRWAGWGDRLHQDEIDALYDKGRLGRARAKGDVTPANLNQYLLMGHDAINRWIVTPIRAKHLGISTDDCFDCVGTGVIPVDDTKIILNVWSFDPEKGTSRVDTAKDVRMEEVDGIKEFMNEVGWEGVKRRFGWATGDNMHPSIRYDENFKLDPNRSFNRSGWLNGYAEYKDWDEFGRKFGSCADELNVVFDYRIIADQSYLDENAFAGSELPPEFGLQLVVLHPRKGEDRVVQIASCTPDDVDEIKDMLRKCFEIHGPHFAWAVGREFGTEKEKEPEAEVEYGSVGFFMGR